MKYFLLSGDVIPYKIIIQKILYVFIWQTNEDSLKIAFYSQLCLDSLSEKVYMLEYLKEPVIPTLANGSFCRNTCRLISPFLL